MSGPQDGEVRAMPSKPEGERRQDKWHPRTRAIRVAICGCSPCFVCGKSKAKRFGRYPAPIFLMIWPTYFLNVKLKKEEQFGGSICMACAKRLCNRLDSVIDQIETSYARRTR